MSYFVDQARTAAAMAATIFLMITVAIPISQKIPSDGWHPVASSMSGQFHG